MTDRRAVVFPTDFSDTSVKALGWATRMARELGGVLHCINIVEPPVAYMAMQASVIVPTAEQLREQAEEEMKRFVGAHFEAASADVKTAILVGRPVDEIVRYASEQEAIMIVMSTHGWSGLAHLLIGSTAEGVVRHAGCPVLTVRGE